MYLGQAFGEKSRTNTIISITTTVLTLFATVVAACYIYYQMRLLMRRNARIKPLLVVPANGRDAPAWGDLADMASAAALATRRHSTGGVIIISAPAGGHHGAGGTASSAAARATSTEISPADVDRAIATHIPDESLPKHIRAQLRGWSVPHHMTEEEMREFAEEMREVAAPMSSSSAPPSAAVPSRQPVFGTSFTSSNRPSQPTPGSFSPAKHLNATRAAPPPFELDPKDSSNSSSSSYPPPSLRPDPLPRGESSMGLLSARPRTDDRYSPV